MTSEVGVDHMFVGVEVGQFGSSLKAKASQVRWPLSTTLPMLHAYKNKAQQVHRSTTYMIHGYRI